MPPAVSTGPPAAGTAGAGLTGRKQTGLISHIAASPYPPGLQKEPHRQARRRPPCCSWLSPVSLVAWTVLNVLTAFGDAAEWTSLPPLPDPLGVAGAFSGVSDGALLVAGGANFPEGLPWDGGRKAWHDTVHVLTDPEGTWQTAGTLPRPLAYGVSFTTDAGILCLGGSDATEHYAEVFRLSWEDGRLQTEILPPLPRPLANAWLDSA